MKAVLLTHTYNPETVVACAAKLCYSPATIHEIQNNISDKQAQEFIDMLASIGHESPIEHASFTFGIEGVSRSLLAQITRHRLASFSVQSQRYVDESSFDFVVPPEIGEIQEAKEEYFKAMDECREHYNTLAGLLREKHEKMYLQQGKSEKEAKKLAHKRAIEDARFVLPNACETKMIATFNARSLKNFFSLRCCNRAQWEIRELATSMLKEVIKVAPALFGKAGPKCLHGQCPEGKMSCGESKKVKEKFDKIRGFGL